MLRFVLETQESELQRVLGWARGGLRESYLRKLILCRMCLRPTAHSVRPAVLSFTISAKATAKTPRAGAVSSSRELKPRDLVVSTSGELATLVSRGAMKRDTARTLYRRILSSQSMYSKRVARAETRRRVELGSAHVRRTEHQTPAGQMRVPVQSRRTAPALTVVVASALSTHAFLFRSRRRRHGGRLQPRPSRSPRRRPQAQSWRRPSRQSQPSRRRRPRARPRSGCP